MPDTRTFDAQKTAEVFRRALDLEQRNADLPAVRSELSLDDLVAAGAEVGISETSIRAAAAELEARPAPRWLGGPTSLRLSVAMAPSALAWDELPLRLQEHFRGNGSSLVHDGVLIWDTLATSSNGQHPWHIEVRPSGETSQVTVSLDLRTVAAGVFLASNLAVGVTGGLILGATFGWLWSPLALLAGWGLGWLAWNRWSGSLQKKARQLLELVTRPTQPRG